MSKEIRNLVFSLCCAALVGMGVSVAHGSWSKSYSINYGSGGDTVKEGVEKIDDELTIIFTKLNNLDNHHAGASAPSSPDTNDIFHDTDDHKLYYYNGSTWVSMMDTASTYTAGISLDTALDQYKRNVFCTENGDNIEVVASAAAPATAMAGTELRQNTSTVQLDKSLLTADTYYIFAKATASVATFELSYDTDNTPTSTENLICTMQLSGVGTVDWIRSEEAIQTITQDDPIGLVQGYLAADETAIGTSGAVVGITSGWTMGIDLDGTYDGTNERWVMERAGYYRVEIEALVDNATSGDASGVYIRKNGTSFAESSLDDPQGNSPFVGEVIRASAIVSLNGSTDYIDFFFDIQADTGDIKGNGTSETRMNIQWIGPN